MSLRERILTFLVIGFLTIMIFVFFFIETQPIPLPGPKASATDSTTSQTPTITFIDPARGAANPKVTIVEYSDVECTACSQLNPLLENILQNDPNDVRLVWKDLPTDSAHPHATSAAVAAHCAQQQGKFWEYATSKG